MEQGLSRADAKSRFTSFECAADWEDLNPCEIIHVGVPRTPEDFLQEAVRKGHPRNLLARVPEAVEDAINNLLFHPLHVRLEKHAIFFARWLKRCLEVREAEASLHRQLPPHLRRVLQGKKLVLRKEILVDLQYQDMAVIDDMIQGASAWQAGLLEPESLNLG